MAKIKSKATNTANSFPFPYIYKNSGYKCMTFTVTLRQVESEAPVCKGGLHLYSN